MLLDFPFFPSKFPHLWGKKADMPGSVTGAIYIIEQKQHVSLKVPMVHNFIIQSFNEIVKSFKILAF